MSKNENSPDSKDEMTAYRYADENILSSMAKAIEQKCSGFIFIWINSNDPKKEYIEKSYYGDNSILVYLCEVMKKHLLEDWR